MNGYESHVPVLEAVLKQYTAAKHVVEFGPGKFSTECFLKAGLHVVSIEMNKGWVETLKALYKPQIDSKQLDIMALDTGYNELHILPELLNHHADIMLIDGGIHNHRAVISQAAIVMDAASVIIVHDSEERIYNYHTIYLPGASPQTEAWTAIEIRDNKPWTTIFSRHPAAIREIAEGFKNIKVYVDDGMKNKEYLR